MCAATFLAPRLRGGDKMRSPEGANFLESFQIGTPVVSLYFSRSRFNSAVSSLTVSA